MHSFPFFTLSLSLENSSLLMELGIETPREQEFLCFVTYTEEFVLKLTCVEEFV